MDPIVILSDLAPCSSRDNQEDWLPPGLSLERSFEVRNSWPVLAARLISIFATATLTSLLPTSGLVLQGVHAKPGDIAIVSGARTPMGRYCGKLKDFTAQELGAEAARDASNLRESIPRSLITWCSVKSIARGLLRIAKHDVIKLFRIDSRTFDRAPGRRSSQFLGCKVFEFPAVAPHGRTRTAYDRNVTGFQHELLQERGQMWGANLLV